MSWGKISPKNIISYSSISSKTSDHLLKLSNLVKVIKGSALVLVTAPHNPLQAGILFEGCRLCLKLAEDIVAVDACKEGIGRTFKC